jgi:hypothetical protein
VLVRSLIFFFLLLFLFQIRECLKRTTRRAQVSSSTQHAISSSTQHAQPPACSMQAPAHSMQALVQSISSVSSFSFTLTQAPAHSMQALVQHASSSAEHLLCILILSLTLTEAPSVVGHLRARGLLLKLLEHTACSTSSTQHASSSYKSSLHALCWRLSMLDL